MKKQTQEQFLETIDGLLEKLADREAECLKLREALTKCDDFISGSTAWTQDQTDSLANDVTEALSTPPSTSYLKQWEKEKYGEPVAWLATSRFMLDSYTKRKTNYVNSNDIVQTPLYARKEK